MNPQSCYARTYTLALTTRALRLMGAMVLVGACQADTTGGTEDSDTAGVTPNPPAPPQPDPGGPFMSHADVGCPVKYVGPNAGTRAISVPRTDAPGSTAWKNPENAFTVNGAFAHAQLGAEPGASTEKLRVTGFGLRVPPQAQIKGVVVQLRRHGDATVFDGTITLWLDGAPSSRPKFMNTAWPSNVGTHHYGQEVDTWGNDLTPELVAKPEFGTEIYALRRISDATKASAPKTSNELAAAEIESLLITVWYCE